MSFLGLSFEVDGTDDWQPVNAELEAEREGETQPGFENPIPTGNRVSRNILEP